MNTERIVFYRHGNGEIVVASSTQASLFKVLSSFGIKSAPSVIFSVITTAGFKTGTYKASYHSGTGTFSTNFTVTAPEASLAISKIIEKAPRRRINKGRSKLLLWRKNSDKHCRNTGR